MALDHEAIYKAYAGTVVSIDDTAGAFDASGNLVTLDQSKIDTARTTLNAEAAAVKYKPIEQPSVPQHMTLMVISLT